MIGNIKTNDDLSPEEERLADLLFCIKDDEEFVNTIMTMADYDDIITANSYSVGIKMEPMYFNRSFSDYTELMEQVYDAVFRLQKLACRIAEDGAV